MSDVGVIVTMVSVGIGFVLFGASFKGFMDRRGPKVVWGLFTAAVVFITLVPVGIAVFWAA
ncbi:MULTISPECIES: hypothetical protein [Corynebacterium]|uniref:Major facilitator superfamily (MFS) profile domain-containing protein n=1 Tax=Corynebacterium provencense TaxID=1737425 RepID=A0A2Z3YZD4_9CORY|nr:MULTISPECIES: hypothetical protein [Corynebacterium]AWT27457.1 hypothetical protein Csp1_27140 [Corynebacterium provencense]MCI1255785.1 hypothetical protein [Corynebacterium provencense]